MDPCGTTCFLCLKVGDLDKIRFIFQEGLGYGAIYGREPSGTRCCTNPDKTKEFGEKTHRMLHVPFVNRGIQPMRTRGPCSSMGMRECAYILDRTQVLHRRGKHGSAANIR